MDLDQLYVFLTLLGLLPVLLGCAAMMMGWLLFGLMAFGSDRSA